MVDQTLQNAYDTLILAVNNLETALEPYKDMILVLINRDRKMGEISISEKVTIANALLRIQKTTGET